MFSEVTYMKILGNRLHHSSVDFSSAVIFMVKHLIYFT